jgi:antitoxin component of MazEF toxin-antitoxin module
MEKVNVRVRRWGNSFGVILPRNVVDSQALREGASIEILVQSKNKTKAGEIFGLLKGKLKRSTDELLAEVDRDFENE